MSGEDFRELRLSCFLNQVAASRELRVSLRTIRNWDAGKRRVPWVVIRFLRTLRLGELAHADWKGWTLYGDRLLSPEGYAFRPSEMNWWSLLVRRSQAFGETYRELRSVKARLHLPAGLGLVRSITSETSAVGLGESFSSQAHADPVTTGAAALPQYAEHNATIMAAMEAKYRAPARDVRGQSKPKEVKPTEHHGNASGEAAGLVIFTTSGTPLPQKQVFLGGKNAATR